MCSSGTGTSNCSDLDSCGTAAMRLQHNGVEGVAMDSLDFCQEIAGVVAVVRSRKLARIAANCFPRRRKRKPRFCVTTTVMLCPRQRESKKYQEQYS